MKNLLLLLLMFLIGSMNAQSFQKDIEKRFSKEIDKLENLEIKSGDYKFCLESKDFNSITNQFEVSENTTIDIKTNGENVSAEVETLEFDEGDTTYLLSKFYTSHRFFDNELEYTFGYPDSMIIYIKDSLGTTLPFAKTITKYSGRLPVEKKSYIDFGLLFEQGAIGLYLSGIETFHYTGDKILYTATKKINLSTGLLETSDSIYNTYDGDNLVEETTFSYLKDSLKYTPSTKTKYTYDDKGNPILSEDYSYYNQWRISKRANATFDTKHREIFSLNEVTYDNGETWIYDDRDSTIYDSPTLYLGFSNREVTEEWVSDDNWRISSISTITDCGSVPDNTTDFNTLDFDARIVDETIVIGSGELFIDCPIVSLIDLQGRIIFSKKYIDLPNAIHTAGLPEGMYILSIRTKNGIGTKKLIKK